MQMSSQVQNAVTTGAMPCIHGHGRRPLPQIDHEYLPQCDAYVWPTHLPTLMLLLSTCRQTQANQMASSPGRCSEATLLPSTRYYETQRRITYRCDVSLSISAPACNAKRACARRMPFPQLLSLNAAHMHMLSLHECPQHFCICWIQKKLTLPLSHEPPMSQQLLQTAGL